jgi:DNA-binding transcriptional MerR regulator
MDMARRTDGVLHDTEALKIGELARRTGLTRQAIHQYVQLGLIRPAQHTRGGQRLFNEEAIRRIELVRKLLDSGYTLQSLRETFFRER